MKIVDQRAARVRPRHSSRDIDAALTANLGEVRQFQLSRLSA